MDQRPGQNVYLGLYFHMEGPVSPKIMLKNDFWPKKSENFKNKSFRAQPSLAPSDLIRVTL